MRKDEAAELHETLSVTPKVSDCLQNTYKRLILQEKQTLGYSPGTSFSTEKAEVSWSKTKARTSTRSQLSTEHVIENTYWRLFQ